jgi:hypothetical protein
VLLLKLISYYILFILQDNIASLKVAKGLYSNFMKMHLKIEKENKIVVSFLNMKGHKCLSAALDKISLTMLEPQDELLGFAKEFEKYGNIALLMLRLRRYAQSNDV